MTERQNPKQPIRRFDVFSEFTKLKRLKEGHPVDEAKGYGLWLAKVVASRRFRPASERKTTRDERPGEGDERERAPETRHERFRSLNEEPQTDELFDREIVARMGSEFYREVFAPAIADAFSRGQPYEAIRDSIRKTWKAGPEK